MNEITFLLKDLYLYDSTILIIKKKTRNLIHFLYHIPPLVPALQPEVKLPGQRKD